MLTKLKSCWLHSALQSVSRDMVRPTIATLDCGCELIDIEGVTFERVTGPCVYHCCRKCGAVPLADSEPDRLCESCWLRASASGTI